MRECGNVVTVKMAREKRKHLKSESGASQHDGSDHSDSSEDEIDERLKAYGEKFLRNFDDGTDSGDGHEGGVAKKRKCGNNGKTSVGEGTLSVGAPAYAGYFFKSNCVMFYACAVCLFC